jgi:hypothetical protein
MSKYKITQDHIGSIWNDNTRKPEEAPRLVKVLGVREHEVDIKTVYLDQDGEYKPRPRCSATWTQRGRFSGSKAGFSLVAMPNERSQRNLSVVIECGDKLCVNKKAEDPCLYLGKDNASLDPTCAIFRTTLKQDPQGEALRCVACLSAEVQ